MGIEFKIVYVKSDQYFGVSWSGTLHFFYHLMQTADSRGRFWLGGILDSPKGGTLSFFLRKLAPTRR